MFKQFRVVTLHLPHMRRPFTDRPQVKQAATASDSNGPHLTLRTSQTNTCSFSSPGMMVKATGKAAP
jgi:hypothetical protein